MARKKETRYGKYQYFRKRITSPDGIRHATIYGRTQAERDEKVEAQKAAWAVEDADAKDIFFVEYAKEWYRRVSGDMTQQRRAVIAREINNNICPVIGAKKLSEISSDDVADVMAKRAGLSRSAQEKTLQTLRRILAAAEDAGKIPKDPSKHAKPGGKKPQAKLALTEKQVTSLLDAIKGLPVELPIRLGLFAGLRREEVYGLQWRDVHLEGPAPHLDVRHVCRWPKNSAPEISEVLKSDAAWRTVPIPPALSPILTSWKASAPKRATGTLSGRTVVETADGRPWTYQTHKRAWSAVEARTAGTVTRRRKDPETGKLAPVQAEKRLGDKIPHHPDVVVSLDFPCASHTLRRTYITRLILGGVDVRRVQYLAGHESADVTLEIYTSLMGHQPEDLIDDVSAIFPV